MPLFVATVMKWGDRERGGEDAARDLKPDLNLGRPHRGLSLCTWGARANHCATTAPHDVLLKQENIHCTIA